MFKKTIVSTLLALALLTSLAAQKVTLATGEYAPYTGEKRAEKGFMTELVMAAANAGGLEVNLEFVPWARAEQMVKEGKALGTFPYTTTDERRKTFDFSDVIYTSQAKIFYYEGFGKDMAWNTIKDFQNSKFGGARGWWYMDDLTKNGIKVDVADSTEVAIAKLQVGRFDYLIENELVALAAIKAQFPNEVAKFKTLAKIYSQDTLSLMVSRTYPNANELLKKFNTGLAAIHKDGTFKKILAKYGLSEK